MYTQHSIKKNSDTYVKYFPNKDAIIQMESLQTKEVNKVPKLQVTKERSINNLENITYDFFILLGLLLSIPETEKIKPDTFMILSGLLLSL